jgi:hypothetical protein
MLEAVLKLKASLPPLAINALGFLVVRILARQTTFDDRIGAPNNCADVVKVFGVIRAVAIPVAGKRSEAIVYSTAWVSNCYSVNDNYPDLDN